MDTKNVAFRLLSRPFGSFDVFPFPCLSLPREEEQGSRMRLREPAEFFGAFHAFVHCL